MLVVGSGHSCLQVLSLMRKTRKELIFKIPNKAQENIKRILDRVRKEGVKTLLRIFLKA